MKKFLFAVALIALASPAFAQAESARNDRGRVLSAQQRCVLDNADRLEPIDCKDPRAVARAEKQINEQRKWLRDHPPGADGCPVDDCTKDRR